MKIKILYILLILALSSSGCTGKKKIPASPSEQFQKAQLKFLDGDYTEAIEILEQFSRLHGATEFGDDAQFLLAGSRYKRKEYLLAATEYRYFVRKYSDSEHVEEARFKLGMCYYKQSPKPEVDQTNTGLAIKEFNRYIVRYGDEGQYSEKVRGYIKKCRNKLAEKTYKNGYTYYKSVRHMVAARKYYQMVLNDYLDTDWVDDAIFGIAETYRLQRDWDTAIENYNKILTEYPDDGELVKKSKEKVKECEEKKLEEPPVPVETEEDATTEDDEPNDEPNLDKEEN